MIDFELTVEQGLVREKIAKTVREKIPAAAAAADREPVPRTPPAFLELIRSERLGALFLPPKAGGLGHDYVTVALILEELAAGCPGLAAMVAATLHAVTPVLMAGTPEQQRVFLSRVTESSSGLAAFAVTEPEAGSDVAAIAATVRHGEKGYFLSGAKCSIFNAGLAGFYLVFASLARERGRAGLCAVVVPADAPGLETGPPEDKLGLRNAPTARVTFQDVFVPENHLIGEEGAGYLLLMQTLDRGRAFSSAVAVGTARAALEACLAWCRERRQFGRALIENQAVSFSLAEMATAIQAARLLSWNACRLIDTEGDYSQAAAMAKLFASTTAERVAGEAMDLFGRRAYNKSCQVDKLWRDAKTITTVEGTLNVQRMVIASLL